MSSWVIWNALAPVAARTPKVVREHEILRVAASIAGKDASKSASSARREVLVWAEKRSGGRLPKEAWDHQDFEHFSGGRNSVGVRIERDGADIWAIRADDPDKQVPGRVWTTEVVVGTLADQQPRFSARLLASTSEETLNIEPHTPGFVQQVAERCGLTRGPYILEAEPWHINSYRETIRLIEMMVDPARKLPLFVLTVPEDSTDPNLPLMNAASLARATLGIGYVAILPATYTWILTDRFGKQRSVFGGAVRVYLPGFADDASPYNHRLVIADNLTTPEGRTQCARWMRTLAGNESTRDPTRCLRIYYSWDPSTQQMIVADMPYHRRTGAS
jgi:hypothetical protein